MKHGSLFSGIGGFDLAASQIGWTNVFHCEINKFCQQVLKYHFPESITYEDIKQTDFTKHRGQIDILSGGFPCQPFSVSGKRLGTNDDRHLWPEMLRAIREIKPTWIVGENVRGFVSWNEGVVFDQVWVDLETEGYKVLPFILPACGINAPHRRDRVWIVAHAKIDRNRGKLYGMESQDGCERESEKCRKNNMQFGNDGEKWTASYTESERPEGKNRLHESVGFDKSSSDPSVIKLQGRMYEGRPEKTKRYASSCNTWDNGRTWENFPTQSPICSRNDGLFTKSHGITIPENRNNMDRDLITKLCLEEGRLKVDFTTGKIYSLKQRGKEGQDIELQGSDCNGYLVHGIRYNGFKIQLRAHQIVWIAANGLYDKSTLMIDHINRNRKDNRLENLRLVDAKGNRENSTEYKGKLSDEQKDMMFWLHNEDGIPMRELAEDFGISKSRVHQIINEHSGVYGITFPKWRNESIKAYGNAIVPGIAKRIFKAIEDFETII